MAKDNKDRLKLDLEKVKAWMAKGALPTDRVSRFLDEAGVMKRETRNNPEKAKPKKKAQERAAAAAAAAAPRLLPQPAAKRASGAAPAELGSGLSARVCIAQIGAAHGVRGEVRLKPFTEDPLSVTRYGALETEDGRRVRDRSGAARQGHAGRAPEGRGGPQCRRGADERPALCRARAAAAARRMTSSTTPT